MKQRLKLPVLSVAAGLAGFALRLLQNRTGFEADTGLPIPGNLPAVLLPVLLAVAAVILFLLACSQPKGLVKRPFSAVFHTEDAKVLTVLVLGVFLMAVSGVLEILNIGTGSAPVEYLTADGLILASNRSAAGQSARFMGLCSVAAAAAVFPSVMACRREKGNPLPVLAAPALLLVRLILAYRVHSVNPVLADYYVELLSLILLILGFYRLSGFTVACGSCRFFSAYAGMSGVLALTLVADGITPAALLAVGGAAVLLGFGLLLNPGVAEPDAADDAEPSES